jgi:hypothetical protein
MLYPRFFFSAYSAHDLLCCGYGLDAISKRFPDLQDFAGDERLEQRIRYEAMYASQHATLQSQVVLCVCRFMRIRNRVRSLLHLQIEEVRREAAVAVPADLDYSRIPGLNMECVEKFEQWRPQNLAAASRYCSPSAEPPLFGEWKLAVFTGERFPCNLQLCFPESRV